MTTTGTIAELFKALGYDWKEMEENVPIDVSDQGFEILSWDQNAKERIYKTINKIVYKGLASGYTIQPWEDEKFWCARDHKLAVGIFELKQPRQEVYIEVPASETRYVPIPGMFYTREHSNLARFADKPPVRIDYVPAEVLYGIATSNGWYCPDTGKVRVLGVSERKPHKSLVGTFFIEPDDIAHPVLDLEVADTECYFAHGILNHNTVYGNPETVTGGQALKFYASQRLDIRKIDVLKEGDDKTGIRCRVKVVKNKVSPPFREAEFSVIFGEGIDWARDLVDLAVEKGLITKSGTWHSYGETKLGQGGAGAATSLRAMPEIAAEIRSKC